MSIQKTNISFEKTNSFSNLAIDYLVQDKKISSFVNRFPSKENLQKQILQKQKTDINRILLHQVILSQYSKIDVHKNVKNNIENLLLPNTFTICTAHQPCIFLGPLYIIYKIAHAISLSQHCKKLFPENNFIPIFYMGTEDNDIDEIGTIHVDSKKIKWETAQTGACGRMNTSDLKSETAYMISLLNQNVEHEKWLIQKLNEAYHSNESLANATRIFTNALFEKYGLLIIDADNHLLKSAFEEVMKDELLNESSEKLVASSIEKLKANYKAQANGRAINLFYLHENIRERIEKIGDKWKVHNTNISFDKEAIFNELNTYPERFSPNVILRPLYQETILPNVAFVGGGGELAYWLELKSVFDYHHCVYPILFLRNSFLWINHHSFLKMEQLHLNQEDVFLPKEKLYKKMISKNFYINDLSLKINQIQNLYIEIEQIANKINRNLAKSTVAHHAKATKINDRLIQKFSTQIKRVEEDNINQIDTVKNNLFPSNTLQERYDNFIPYFKKYGENWIEYIINAHSNLESEFIIFTEKESSIL